MRRSQTKLQNDTGAPSIIFSQRGSRFELNLTGGYPEMKSRHDEIKQAVRLGVRKIRSTDIEGDLATMLIKRFQIIKGAVEFVVRDITPEELSVAIIETFNEIDLNVTHWSRLRDFVKGKWKAKPSKLFQVELYSRLWLVVSGKLEMLFTHCG